MTSRAPWVVVLDTSVLINMLHVARLELCAKVPDLEVVAPDEVCAEITDPAQQARLDVALRGAALRVVPLNVVSGLALYAQLRVTMGRGESACLALADAHGWLIATDEKRRFLRTATARLGPDRILTTPDLYVRAIRAGLLTVAEADQDKALLEGRRFKMAFASFHDRLDLSMSARDAWPRGPHDGVAV